MTQETRKIILFLVEGVTDRIALAGPLKKLIKYKYENKVDFKVCQCDVTSDYKSNSSNIKNIVFDKIKDYLKENKLKNSDLLRIIHLVDTDGTYINENCIVEGVAQEYLYYRDHILCKNRDEAIQRNLRKRRNLDVLVGEHILAKIPYVIYFFSVNIEDVLFNKLNCSNAEKMRLCEKFDDSYRDNTEEFINIFKDYTVFLPLNYKDSWEFLRRDNHSLERYSNFSLFINWICSN